ncbi:MAG: amidohydrolase [Clostridia bacterium]|nr:amidohydrolase [Clostridia bacterium]
MQQVLTQAHTASPEALALRRAIHRRPELGNAEHETAALIVKTMESLGWEVARPVGTSVMATLEGARPGRTVALRADMDALRISEETGLPFKSEIPGVMHACGHDFHTAALLGAAMVLTEHRPTMKGRVRLLFQPDEEGSGGAARMIAAGCLEGVDAVLGAHVDPDLPAGTAGFKYGKMYAASDVFRVVVHGEGCHGASPEAGIDAIAVAAQAVTALQQIVSRRLAPTDAAVITVGSFHAGAQANVVADRAEIEGILRTLGPDTRRRVKALFTETVTGVCAAMGARAEIDIRESYPGVVNDDGMVDFAKAAATEILGGARVVTLDTPTMATEDFGCFTQEVPGAFYKIGVGNPDVGAVWPIHSPKFVADEAAMPNLIALHAGMALRFLEQ